MTTSTNCAPNGDGFSLVSTWILSPNAQQWIEIGVASGQIDGTCYPSQEHHYLAYRQSSVYTEHKLTGTINPGDNIYYQISDTNQDDTWQAFTGNSQCASLIMGHDYGTTITGLESKDDNTSVPRTDVKYIQEYDGTTWNYWTKNTMEFDLNEGFITQCTPAYQTIKVGVGGSENC